MTIIIQLTLFFLRVKILKGIDLEMVVKLGVDKRFESRPFKFMLFICLLKSFIVYDIIYSCVILDFLKG